jgi:aryl-alcohol dehydrogenase-like predicted oxidoreductase
VIAAARPAANLIAGAATLAGTKRFRNRNIPACNTGHFRETCALVLSTTGIGTARGEVLPLVDQQITSAICRSVTSGINVIDTSANYRDGWSERAVGEAVKALVQQGVAQRDELFIATKGGYLPLATGSPHDFAATYLQSIGCRKAISEVVQGCHLIHPEFLEHQLAKSLANLGLETIDLYYLHNPEIQLRELSRAEFKERLSRAFIFLEKMCRAGAIRRYGIATWHGLRVDDTDPLRLDLEEISEITRAAGHGAGHHFEFVQAPVNPLMPEFLINTQCVRGRKFPFAEAARTLGLGVIASAAAAQGQSLASVRGILGDDIWSAGDSDAQRALQFVRSIPHVASCLVGMKAEEHVTEILKMNARPPLPPDRFLASMSSATPGDNQSDRR